MRHIGSALALAITASTLASTATAGMYENTYMYRDQYNSVATLDLKPYNNLFPLAFDGSNAYFATIVDDNDYFKIFRVNNVTKPNATIVDLGIEEHASPWNKYVAGLEYANGNILVSYRPNIWGYSGCGYNFIACFDANTGEKKWRISAPLDTDPVGMTYDPISGKASYLAHGHSIRYLVDLETGETTKDISFVVGGVAMAYDYDSQGNAAYITTNSAGKANLVYKKYDAETQTYDTQIVSKFNCSFTEGYEVEIIEGVTSDPLFAISAPSVMTLEDGTELSVEVPHILNIQGTLEATCSTCPAYPWLGQRQGIDFGFDENGQPVLVALSAYNKDMFTYRWNTIPEPASLALLGLGGIALLARRRK